MFKRWLLIAATLSMAVLALAFVACDDDDDDEDGAEEPTATEALEEPTEPAGETPGAAAEPIDVVINPVGESEVTGTATLDTDGTTTLVVVEITAGLEEGTMHQSHIHHGNCSDPTGEIHVNLESIEGKADGTGMASTEDPADSAGETPAFDHWTAREHYVAVHASDGTVIGCGDVPGAPAA